MKSRLTFLLCCILSHLCWAQQGAVHPTGNFYALIIGESVYANPKLTLDRPAQDAARIKAVLLHHYTFDEEHVKLLLNATRKQVISELYNLRKTLTPNDNLLIFYAGHGYWDEDSKQGYWWPSDAAIDEPSNWLSNSDLKEQIRGIKTAHTLLISDACFSGGIFKTRSGAEAIRQSALNIQMQYKMPSRRAMTSGTLTTVPDESVFFSYLVKRLEENTEPFLASEDLFASLKQAVINNSMVVPQDGVIADAGDEGGDFIFIRRDGAAANTSTPVLATNDVKRGGVTTDASTILEKGKALFNNNRYGPAYELFTRVIVADSTNYDALVYRGRCSFNLKNLDEAFYDYSRAIRINPANALAWCLRGQVRNQRRKYNAAIEDFNHALELNPRYTNAFHVRGYSYMELRQYPQALADFDAALHLDPRMVYSWAFRGFVKSRMGKNEEALLDFNKAIEINPTFALPYCDRGLAELQMGHPEKALEDINRAIALDPKLPRAYNNRGLYHMNAKDYAMAVQDFTHAVDLGANYLDARVNRAKAYLAEGNKTSALEDLNAVLQANPKHEEALALKNGL